MNLQQLSNEELIEACKDIPLTTELDLNHIEELITRFKRIILGQQADEAIQELEELQQPTLETSRDFIISKDNPVKKVQRDDEVEALARELFLREASIDRIDYFNSYYDLAEQFINHRNERRGKNGK
jgi:hypothetical protein